MFIRNIAPNEKCKFCDNVHVSWVQIHDNRGSYTSMYNMPFCEDHRDHAIAEKERIQSSPAPKGHFWD